VVQSTKGLPNFLVQRLQGVAKQKEQKLKNPNYIVSKTRIVARNLPKELTSKELKDSFVKALARKAPIKQCKVVASKDGKSKCFGFLEYHKHEDALEAVQKSSNIPGFLQGHPHNPIFVEFALENMHVLAKRTMKYQRQIDNPKPKEEAKKFSKKTTKKATIPSPKLGTKKNSPHASKKKKTK